MSIEAGERNPILTIFSTPGNVVILKNLAELLVNLERFTDQLKTCLQVLSREQLVLLTKENLEGSADLFSIYLSAKLDKSQVIQRLWIEEKKKSDGQLQ